MWPTAAHPTRVDPAGGATEVVTPSTAFGAIPEVALGVVPKVASQVAPRATPQVAPGVAPGIASRTEEHRGSHLRP